MLRLLGQGSFATVYLGEHLYLERPAAIKVLHVQMESETHEAFRREARLIAQLQHPHIVSVFDFGFQGQTPYLVMEYTPNGTLQTQHPSGTRLSLEQVVTYVKQIASALDHAHEHLIIHRDVKPANLLLNAKGEVVLSDFGLAVVQRTLESLSEQNLAGTPLYMAPEQIQHRPCAASDQYALGVLVYEWLCGTPPFRGSLFEVFSQHLHQLPSSLCAHVPQLPSAVEDAVFRALAKDPTQRFALLQDFATVLEEVSCATQPLSLHRFTPKATREQDPLTRAESVSVERASDCSDEATHPQIRATQSAGSLQADEALLSIVGDPRQLIEQRPVLSPSTLDQQNRTRLLEKVSLRSKDLLDQSLQDIPPIPLQLRTQPAAVRNIMRLRLRQGARPQQDVPAATPLVHLYDQVGGELLILGAPGAGKTTLLLELACALQVRARQEQAHPIPVIVNLSTWVNTQHPLDEWLVEEITRSYEVPRLAIASLVKQEQILPLLDGLDELPGQARGVCIEALNTFKQRHWLPLVVCSRSQEYLAQAQRLTFQSAVLVQPLSEDQVDAYFKAAGQPVAGIRSLLHSNAELRELVTTPLLLHMVTLAYWGVPMQALPKKGTIEVQQRQIFDQYVQQRLEQQDEHARFSPQQTRHWLTFLAGQMRAHNQTVFYLEHLQPDWLPEGPMRDWYERLATRGAGIVIGSVLSLLIMALLFGGASLPYEVWYGCMGGLVGGLISGSGATGFQLKGIRRLFFQKWRSLCAAGVGNGVLVGGLVVAGFALWGGFPYRWLIYASSASVCGFVLTVIIGCGKVLVPQHASPVPRQHWWSRLLPQGLQPDHLRCGIIVGLSVGLNWGLHEGLSVGLSVGLSLSIAYWILFGLWAGVSRETLDDRLRTKPNQGMRSSARSALLVGLLAGGICFLVGLLNDVLYGVLSSWLSYLSSGPSSRLSYLISGIMIGCTGALLAALLTGGLASLRHLLLRFSLRHLGVVPRHYACFLDDTARRVLLYKDGGGYRFIHRLFLDYWADLEVSSLPTQRDLHQTGRANQQSDVPASSSSL